MGWSEAEDATRTPVDPRTTSDRELQAACAPRGWERQLERFGCLSSLLLSLGAAIAIDLAARDLLGLSAGASLTLAALALPVAGPAAYALLHRSFDRRRNPLRAELRRRYGLDPGETYAEEERKELEGEDAPAVALILSAASLPHGGRHWVRIHLWRTPHPRARVDVRLVRWAAGVGNIEGAELLRDEGELSDPHRAELLALLDDPGPGALATVPSHVRDGMPATVTIVERGSGEVHGGTCNLADAPAASRRHPTVRFADAILRAAALPREGHR